MRRVWAVLLVAAAAAAPATRARAGELHDSQADITNVASAFDEDNPFDVRFRVDYLHTEKRAQIKREVEGLSATQDTIAVLRDLAYSESRDELSLRAEVGLFQDLMFHAELPIILGEQETYGFDQSAGSACRYAPDPMPDCVNALNSTTIRDGIIGAPMMGSSTLLVGPKRGASGGSGLDAFDTFNFGLTWAPVAQHRDDTKPTWVLAVEPHISIGNIKAYDRARPDANHAVSEGIHRLYFRTAISHRWRYIEPYIGFWYMYPIARSDSLFKDYGPSQKNKNPQMQGGTVFGAELIAYEKLREGHKVYFDLRGRIEGHFQGLGYSEAWQLLASAPPLACDMAQGTYNPACNPTLTTNAYQNQPFTGITFIDNYATLGADIAFGVQIARHVRIRLAFEYTHDQAHFITGDDIGVPSTSSGRVMLPAEFNPAYRAVVDQVGRRYKVDNVDVYGAGAWAQMQF